MNKFVTILACLMLAVSVNAGVLINLPDGTVEDEVITTGKVWYVSSVTGSDDHSGTSPDYPVATIDKAIGLCTASKGDVIYVMAGHAETISAANGILCDVKGISIIGLGNGDDVGTVTLDTSVATDVSITADNVTIKNLHFVCGLDQVTDMIDIDTDVDYTTIDNCYFMQGNASYQALCAIEINGGSSFTTVSNCEFFSTTIGANEAIEIGLNTAVARTKILNNLISGDFANACIYSALVNTNITVKSNYLSNTNTGEHVIEFSAATTGVISYNSGYCDMTQATGIDPGSCKCIENYTTDAVDVSGILTPAGT